MSRIEEVIKAILGEGEITSDLISRLEKIFEAIYEDGMYKGYTLSRSEEIVLAILKGERYDGPAIGRIEQILKAIANDGHYDGPVISRVEELLIKWFTEYHKVVEFTGEFPATIRSTGNDIVNYRIYGNTVQDGEPSPDNPVDVVGCGVPVNIELDEPLCGIGEYKDTLDLATGIVTRRIKKLVLTGEEAWNTASSFSTKFEGYFAAYLRVSGSLNNFKLVSNIGTYAGVVGSAPSGEHFTSTTNFLYFHLSNERLGILDTDNLSERLTKFKDYIKQYIKTHDIFLWYVLAEPETETISVPKGLTGTIEGYLIQDGEPTPDNPIYPKANGGDLTPQKTNLLANRTIKPNGYFDTSGTWVPDKSYQTYTSVPVTEDLYSLSFTKIQNGSEIYLNLFDAQMNLLANITPYEGPAGNLNFTIHQTGNLAISYNPSAISDLVLVHGEEPGPTEPPTYGIPLGYKLPIVTSGVNLFDKDNTITGLYNQYGSWQNVAYCETSEFIHVRPGSYCLSQKHIPQAPQETLYINFWDVDKNFVKNLGKYTTTTSGYRAYAVDDVGYVTVSYTTERTMDIMLTPGSTPPTQYEPYHHPITTDIYLGSEPLHKIGDYADYVDFERGVVVRNVKKLVLTGEETWDVDYCSFKLKTVYNILSLDIARNTDYAKSSHYKIEKFPSSTNLDDGEFYLYSPGYELRIKDDQYTSINDFKSYLADQYNNGTPITIWYVLQTPEEEILPVPFPKIPTFDGTTILDVPEDLYPRPSKVELEYYGDLYMTADNKLYRMPNGEFLGG